MSDQSNKINKSNQSNKSVDAEDQELKSSLANELHQLATYLSTHKLDSYIIIVNSSVDSYFYVWNYKTSPALLLAYSDIVLHELKTNIVKALDSMSITIDEASDRASKLNKSQLN